MEKLILQPIDYSKVKDLIAKEPIRVIDTYAEQLQELFFIRNPKYRFLKDFTEDLSSFIATHCQENELQFCGKWFYYEWQKTVIHVLDEDLFLELRTARNKNLITSEEQQRFYESTVAVAGLSVGSHGALTIVMTGGAKKIKLADFDTITLSNLNRLRYGCDVLGESKVLVAARQILTMNPYAQVYLYIDGVKPETCEEFLKGSDKSPQVDLLLEGVDNLEIKILLRQVAQQVKIPVLMATDNGDGIIVDIERYDVEPQPKLFNGALGDISPEIFSNFIPTDLPKLATKVAGPEYIVPRMLASLMEVGNSLYSWPQLGTAATFTGVATAYLARAIINKKNIGNGKFDINLEKIFDNDCATSIYQEQQKKYLQQMGL